MHHIDPIADIIIIGGGLAGLITAIELSGTNYKVLLIEKNKYPFHRVCGEYISNEVKQWMNNNGYLPDNIEPSNINQLQLTSPSGKSIYSSLDLGGFGISRYTLDNYLYKLAKQNNIQVLESTEVTEVVKINNSYQVHTNRRITFTGKLIIGSFGKRSILDRTLQRKFFKSKSPYLAVKYHLKYDQGKNLIALHHFKDGYAGISAIENDKYCFCYIVHRRQLKKYKTIQNLEKELLSQNPYIKDIFTKGVSLWEKPLVINEISFAPKELSQQNIIFCGDSAGMIAPLCGNGMSMAIHSAKLLTENIVSNKNKLENFNAEFYKKNWLKNFKIRLMLGRKLQAIFGSTIQTELVLFLFKLFPKLLNIIIKKTHGKIIN